MPQQVLPGNLKGHVLEGGGTCLMGLTGVIHAALSKDTTCLEEAPMDLEL